MISPYPFQQFAKKPQSRVLAIKAFCAHCCGGPTSEEQLTNKGFDSDWKKTIRECPTTTCPLHTFRPFQNK